MPKSRPPRRRAFPGPTIALLFAFGLLLHAICQPLPARAAPTDAEIAEAVEAVLSNNRFQTELPNDAEPAEAQPVEEPDWRFDLPDGVLGLARVLMWLLVGAGALLLVIFVVNELSSFRLRPRGRAGQDIDPNAATGGATAKPGAGLSLDEADRLAREGRFAEALHMLLLDCIAQLRRLKFDAVIAPSLTSREVARRLSLPERSAQALTAIVSAVELSHFGGRPAGEDDYRRGREHYLQIAHESAGASQ